MRDGNFRGSRCTEGRSTGEGVNVLHSVEAAPFTSLHAAAAAVESA